MNKLIIALTLWSFPLFAQTINGVPNQSVTAIPNASLGTQTANTVLGALTATTPNGLAVPSCAGATNALIWTSGTGFGCNAITASSGASIVVYSGPSLTLSGTLYFPIGGGGLTSATEANVDIDSPAAATIQNFSVQMSAAPGIGNSVVYTWRKNAAGTALTCTISGAVATSCSDTTHSFTVVQGDLMSVQAVTTGTIVGTPTVVMGTQFGIASSGGGSSGMSLLFETSPTTVATIPVVTRNVGAFSGAIFQSDFDDYVVKVINCIPATNTVQFFSQVSTNGGSSYDNTASIYYNANYHWQGGAAFTGTGAAAQMTWDSDGTPEIINTASAGGISGTYEFFSPLSTSVFKSVSGTGILWPNASTTFVGATYEGSYKATTAVNAFQVYFSSGNVASCTVRVYGIAK